MERHSATRQPLAESVSPELVGTHVPRLLCARTASSPSLSCVPGNPNTPPSSGCANRAFQFSLRSMRLSPNRTISASTSASVARVRRSMEALWCVAIPAAQTRKSCCVSSLWRNLSTYLAQAFLAVRLVNQTSTFELSVTNMMIRPFQRSAMAAARRMRHINSATEIMTSSSHPRARVVNGPTTSLTLTLPNTLCVQSAAPITSSVLSPPAHTSREAVSGNESCSGMLSVFRSPVVNEALHSSGSSAYTLIVSSASHHSCHTGQLPFASSGGGMLTHPLAFFSIPYNAPNSGLKAGQATDAGCTVPQTTCTSCRVTFTHPQAYWFMFTKNRSLAIFGSG